MQFKKDKYENFISVEGEWLNGKPHGVCIFEDKFNRGIATFTHGEKHGGPKWEEFKELGIRWSYEYIDNGKEKGVYRVYQSDP